MINLIMCYLLIGKAELNMVGAAIANNLQMAGNFLCMMLTVMVCKRARQFIRRPSRESCKGWLEIIKLGIPSYLMMFLDMSALEGASSVFLTLEGATHWPASIESS